MAIFSFLPNLQSKAGYMKTLILVPILFSFGLNLFGQENYRAYIVRPDNNLVVFNITGATENGQKVFYIIYQH